MKRIAVPVVEYLLGFFALAIFAGYAFSQAAPTDERFVAAFKLGACAAGVELVVLFLRKPLANRLIVGANIWLLVGGLAAFTEQWWVLRGYQSFGEASLFLAILLVGLVTTVVLPGGFVATVGPQRKVLAASGVLLTAVVVALFVAIAFRGNIKFAAVLPVIGLSWLNRALQRFAASAA